MLCMVEEREQNPGRASREEKITKGDPKKRVISEV